MLIAQAKRRENIAEYILYLWQIEDLLRALQFSPEAIYTQLIQPQNLPVDHQQRMIMWYMDIVNLLREEGKEEKGHLEHTLHLINNLNDLHLRLLKLPVGETYRGLFDRLAPELPALREHIGDKDVTDIELCFRALYAVMLYRIGKKENTAVSDVIEYISPVIAELASVHGKIERGETDMFRE